MRFILGKELPLLFSKEERGNDRGKKGGSRDFVAHQKGKKI